VIDSKTLTALTATILLRFHPLLCQNCARMRGFWHRLRHQVGHFVGVPIELGQGLSLHL